MTHVGSSTVNRTTSSTAVDARALTWTVKETMRAQAGYLQALGLPLDQYAAQAESIERGLLVWMLTGHAQQTSVDVYDANSGRVEQRFDIDLAYAAEQGPEAYQSRIDIVGERAREKPLSGPKSYRVTVTTSAGAPPVPGWGPAAPLNMEGLQREDIGPLFSSARIGGRGGLWR